MKKIIALIMAFCIALAAYGQEPENESGEDKKTGEESGAEREEKEEEKKSGRVAGSPEITFETEEHDFGKISESGKKARYDFLFTNTGDRPLVVTRTITSCKCTDISYPKKPVPPGGEGYITVTYNPKKQHGVFHKTIQVYSNTPDKVDFIRIKGEVVP